MLHATPTVFVVDDDVSVRKSLELLIDSAGWRPATFASAQEFLHHPRPVSPSCLVLDVSLPDLNGLELQKRVAPVETISNWNFDTLVGGHVARTGTRADVAMQLAFMEG